MNTKFLPIGLQLVTVGATVLAASPSQAAIIRSSIKGGLLDGSGSMTTLGLKIIDPVPEEINITGFEEKLPDGKMKYTLNPDPNRDLLGIVEKQSVALTRNLRVLSAFDLTNTRLNSQIAKNTLVSSYLFYLNPPGSSGRGDLDYRWVGKIKFDAPVLGIIGGFSAGFVQTVANGLVGLDDTTYNIQTALDPGQDFVTFKGKVLHFDITAKTGRDPFRVIIDGTPKAAQAAPEPMTLLGSLSAVGFGTWFRKARSKVNTKGKNKQHD